MKHDNQSLLLCCSALKYDYQLKYFVVTQSLQDELKDQATHQCDISMMPVNLCDNKYCIYIYSFPIANSAFLPHKEVAESQAMTTQPAEQGPHCGAGTRPHLELLIVQFERA